MCVFFQPTQETDESVDQVHQRTALRCFAILSQYPVQHQVRRTQEAYSRLPLELVMKKVVKGAPTKKYACHQRLLANQISAHDSGQVSQPL